jgi:Ni,Fe-hydrogenase III component G
MDLRLLLAPDVATEGVISSPVPDDVTDFDDFDDRGAEGTTESTADTASPEPASPDASTAAPPAPTDPNLAASDRRARPGAPPPENWRGVREVAEGLGFRFTGNPSDDHAAMVELVRQAATARQSDYYAQVGRQLAPHAPKIQQYLASQQAPAAPEKSPWDRPEFDARWAQLGERDPGTGVFVGKPGVAPEIVAKVNDYLAWHERKESDPEGYMTHVVNKVFKQQFAEQFQQYRQQTAQEQAISEIQRSNSEWLYQRDPQGQVVFGYDRRPVPSAAGQRYLFHVQRATQMGISDPRYQNQYAIQAVQNEIYAAQVQKSEATQAQASSPQTRQARTAPNRNPIQSMPAQDRIDNPAAPEQSTVGLSLNEALKREMSGFGDDEFNLDQIL